MIRVKICGLTVPENAKLVAETGIDFAGFIFYPGSKRYVGNNPEMRLFNSIPANICKVGVFVNEDPIKVIAISKQAGFKMVQLHGNENLSCCSMIKASGLQVIKAFRAGKEIDLKYVNDYSEVCDYYLFDTGIGSSGGSGMKFNWNLLKGISFKKPFFLSGGIGPEDADELKKIQNDMLYAVDINSRFEIKPGLKDIQKVKLFVEQIKKE